MITNKLTLTFLGLLLGMATTIANPISNSNCCKPKPVGGMESLKNNTLYPVFEQQVGLEAEVLLNFTVDAQGNVSQICVAQSGGHNFDKSAIMAVKSTRWNPAMQNGYPVKVTFELQFEYRTH